MMIKKNNRIPTNPYNDQYSSLIRPIKIFLPPSEKKDAYESNEYDDYVGRERLMQRLYNWLSDKKNDRGSYLVTGFRGMGKTKLVERVTERLTREVKEKQEPWWMLFFLAPMVFVGLLFANSPKNFGNWWWMASLVLLLWLVASIFIYYCNLRYYKRKSSRA